MQAHYSIKVQMIRAKGRNPCFYVVVPMPLAAAIELQAGELVQWTLTDKQTLQVRRYPSANQTTHPKPKKK